MDSGPPHTRRFPTRVRKRGVRRYPSHEAFLNARSRDVLCVCECVGVYVCVCLRAKNNAEIHTTSARMDVEEAMCVWLLHRRLKRRKQRNRKYWVHPILQDRPAHGMYTTLYPRLREHKTKFFNYFRMSLKSSTLHVEYRRGCHSNTISLPIGSSAAN